MEKQSLRIVYMGTPEFAAEGLRALVAGGYRVAGVVTMPDKPSGRHGNRLQASPVKIQAGQLGIPVLQPERLKDASFLSALRAWEADVQVVVAFRMLPEEVWGMPRFGTFNLHASLLPQYRGAAPIHRAVMRGEEVTGVTTFFLSHGMDTGRVILQRGTPIGATEDAGTVHDRLMRLGAELIVETVDLLLAGEGKVETVAQSALVRPGVALCPAPKLIRETCRIDWRQGAQTVCNFIRGLSPSPAAWTEWEMPGCVKALSLKIFRAEALDEAHVCPVGTVRSDGATFLDVAAGEGYVRLHSLQLAGKKRLDVRQFLNGVRGLAPKVR